MSAPPPQSLCSSTFPPKLGLCMFVSRFFCAEVDGEHECSSALTYVLEQMHQLTDAKTQAHVSRCISDSRTDAHYGDACTDSRINACTQTHVRTHICKMHVWMHRRMHRLTYRCMYGHTDARCTHTRPCRHAQTHVQMHRCMHRHMYRPKQAQSCRKAP